MYACVLKHQKYVTSSHVTSDTVISFTNDVERERETAAPNFNILPFVSRNNIFTTLTLLSVITDAVAGNNATQKQNIFCN